MHAKICATRVGDLRREQRDNRNVRNNNWRDDDNRDSGNRDYDRRDYDRRDNWRDNENRRDDRDYNGNRNNDFQLRNGRYYRGGRVYNGAYGGFYYHDGNRFSANIVYFFGGRYYRNGAFFSGYDSGYRYDNGFRYRRNNVFEGVVVGRSGIWLIVRRNDGSTFRVRERSNEFRRLRNGNFIRFNGHFDNGDIFVDGAIVLR